jgi:hypothetical protein
VIEKLGSVSSTSEHEAKNECARPPREILKRAWGTLEASLGARSGKGQSWEGFVWCASEDRTTR